MEIRVMNDLQKMPGKLVVFWSGGKAGTGVTSTCYHLAQYLAEKGFNVTLADLNLKSPELSEFLVGDVNNSSLTIDTLKPLLVKGDIKVSEVLTKTFIDRKYKNLRYLLGTNFPYALGYFSIIEMDALLDALRLTGEIILIDVAAYPDNPATIAALAKADAIKLVVESDISCVKLFKAWEDTFSTLHIKTKSSLIINKTCPEDSITLGDLEKTLGIKADGCLSLLNMKLGKNECLPLERLGSKRSTRQYQKQLHILAEAVIGNKITQPESKFKIKTIFKRQGLRPEGKVKNA